MDWLLIAIVVAAVFVFQGWLLMVASGIVGHAFADTLFFISFGQSLAATLFLSVVGSIFGGIGRISKP